MYVSENGNLRAHYTKTTVRAGEVLRLTAVFQDTRRAPFSSGVSGLVGSGVSEIKNSRSSERDRYAQCLDAHGHELFAPLATRGEFYAICQSANLDTGSDALLYRIHHLAKRDFPLRVIFCPTNDQSNPLTVVNIFRYAWWPARCLFPYREITPV